MIVHHNRKNQPRIVQQHQTLLLIIATQNTDWEASYHPFIWPHQQTTVAENESTSEKTLQSRSGFNSK